MGVKENLRVVEQALEAYNAHDYGRVLEFFSESTIFLYGGMKEPVRGREAMRQWEEPMYNDTPDLHIHKDRILGQGDWVCLEWTGTGSEGGKAFLARGIELFKVEGGKITERHLYSNSVEPGGT